MRWVRVAAVVLTAAVSLQVAGCASSDEPNASDTPTTSATPSDDGQGNTDGDASGNLGDFPEVDGYTLTKLPDVARNAFEAATQNAPQIDGFEGRLVEKGGEQVGMVMRVGLGPDQAKLPAFEKQFLPGFASGIAGADAKPRFDEVNGVKVVKIQTPGADGMAYAWIQDAVATVLVFKTPNDAATYAQGALA